MALNQQFFADLKVTIDSFDTSVDGPSWLANAVNHVDRMADSGHRDYVALRNYLRHNPTTESYIHELEELINGRAVIPHQSDDSAAQRTPQRPASSWRERLEGAKDQFRSKPRSH